MENIVHEHIQKFPVIDSHYCQADSQKKYLEEGLTLAEMYRMYKAEMEPIHGPEKLVSIHKYRDIFCTHYNYGFFIPKKDQ